MSTRKNSMSRAAADFRTKTIEYISRHVKRQSKQDMTLAADVIRKSLCQAEIVLTKRAQ